MRDFIEPADRSGIALTRFFAHALRQGDDGDRLADVIEDAQRVIKGKIEVGQLAIVRRSIGQMFGVADDVVARVSDRSTDEGWQRVDRSNGGAQVLAQSDQRILDRLRHRRAVFVDHRQGVADSVDPLDRVGGQKAVPAHFFAADHAFEQAGRAALIQQRKGGHRGQRVAEQAAEDRDEVVLGGQASKGREIRLGHITPGVK